jgi:hypothetical protein
MAELAYATSFPGELSKVSRILKTVMSRSADIGGVSTSVPRQPRYVIAVGSQKGRADEQRKGPRHSWEGTRKGGLRALCAVEGRTPAPFNIAYCSHPT